MALTRRDVVRMGLASAGMLALGGRARAAGSFHLGLVTYNVAKDWDLDTLLRLVREAGLEGVEFRTTHAHGVERTLDPAQRAEVRKKCADAGLLQTSLGSVCEFHSPDPAVVRKNVEDCREWVLLAKDIGARGVKVRPNGLPKDVPEEKTLEQIGRALAECGAFAGDHGVEIWVEVHGDQTKVPGPDAPDHGRLLAPERRPDLELERHGRHRTARWPRPSRSCGPSSAAATSPTCAAAIPTASCSPCSGSRASPASRCASSRRRSPRPTGPPGSRTTEARWEALKRG